MNKEIKFKGWDWTELLQLFPELQKEYNNKVENPTTRVNYPKPGNWIEAEQEIGKKLASRICSYMCPTNHSEEEKQKTIEQLRVFLTKVTEASGYYEPYFQGILNIEYDDCFLQVFSWNVTCMWT